MASSEIELYIKFTKISSGDSIKIEQRYVKLREGQNRIMTFSYKAPIFEMIEFERFFENTATSERINVDIGGTGDIGTQFRGIIEGKEKNYSQNIDHKILLLEEYKCPSKEDLKKIKPTSRFVKRVIKDNW